MLFPAPAFPPSCRQMNARSARAWVEWHEQGEENVLLQTSRAMTSRLIGMIVIVVGVLIVAFRRPLAVFQVRSQPRIMHPWKNAVQVSQAMILVIGLGVIGSGIYLVFMS